jgi:hypothetical protein
MARCLPPAGHYLSQRLDIVRNYALCFSVMRRGRPYGGNITNAPSIPLRAAAIAVASFQSPSTNSTPWSAHLPLSRDCAQVLAPVVPDLPDQTLVIEQTIATLWAGVQAVPRLPKSAVSKRSGRSSPSKH